MDFFGHQDDARRRTLVLLALFIIASLLIAATVNGLTVLVVAWQDIELTDAGVWRLHLLVSFSTLLLIGAGSLYKWHELRGRGAAIALRLGGVVATREDSQQKRLLDVVEEMAIAAGLPVPDVFVLPGEMGINAFAAGHDHDDAAIAVTEGCLRKLDRHQLQAVIAHEFSHILHGDMRLNLRMVAVLHGILLLALLGAAMVRAGVYGGEHRHSERKGGAVLPLLALGGALWLIGSLGKLIGEAIRAATSRQRELLADAAAVQFTRNPSALAGALQRIAVGIGSRIKHPGRFEFSHLFFGESMRRYEFFNFASHPSLTARIRAIDPTWDGQFPEPEAIAAVDRQTLQESDHVDTAMKRRAQATGQIAGGLAVASLLDQIGSLDCKGLKHSAAVLADLPDAVREASHDPFSARAILLCLLLDDDETERAKQFAILAEDADAPLQRACRELNEAVRGCGLEARLPLIESCLPAVRQLSCDQYRTVRSLMKRLIAADEQVTWAEFIVYRLVRQHGDRVHGLERNEGPRIHHLRAIQAEVRSLLGCVARIGHRDPALQRAAYETGMRRCLADLADDFPPASVCRMRDVDAALKKTSRASLGVKRAIINACAWCIAADGVIEREEQELLRLICAAFDCPMPVLTTN